MNNEQQNHILSEPQFVITATILKSLIDKKLFIIFNVAFMNLQQGTDFGQLQSGSSSLGMNLICKDLIFSNLIILVGELFVLMAKC